jgi:hypothetical protein
MRVLVRTKTISDERGCGFGIDEIIGCGWVEDLNSWRRYAAVKPVAHAIRCGANDGSTESTATPSLHAAGGSTRSARRSRAARSARERVRACGGAPPASAAYISTYMLFWRAPHEVLRRPRRE